ncbi:hypothetical protein EV200_102490 [Pedobacter psychrotolerans]|uniref:Uncharacterized protein n=1 Tax=Pedobacter psychrotolerans TaxID=1843235 RepID=A0A4R2HIF2_9SPHI|nr:hypothetical protein EV200_102490 [Pedobacter psychrotolerans]
MILIFSHLSIFALPFIINKSYFKRTLIVTPIIFVFTFSILNIGFLALLIPFIIFWGISLSIVNDTHLNFSYKIPGKHKFEGITLFKQAKNKMEFLLCEDRDTEELDTTIYKLSLTF